MGALEPLHTSSLIPEISQNSQDILSQDLYSQESPVVKDFISDYPFSPSFSFLEHLDSAHHAAEGNQPQDEFASFESSLHAAPLFIEPSPPPQKSSTQASPKVGKSALHPANQNGHAAAAQQGKIEPVEDKKEEGKSNVQKQGHTAHESKNPSSISPASFEALKSNVKLILNSIRSSTRSLPQNNQPSALAAQKSGKKPVIAEKVVRIHSESAQKGAAPQHLETTTSHLLSKIKQKSETPQGEPKKGSNDTRGDLKSIGSQTTKEPAEQRKAAKPQTPRAVDTPENQVQHRKANASEQLKELASVRKKKQTQEIQPKQQDAAKTIASPSENIQEPNTPLDATPDLIQSTRNATESQMVESELNQQFSKGTEKSQVMLGSDTKTKASSRTARSMHWLKALEERTTLLDKTNPRWKVLEMQLAEENGSMTIKVMKEDEQVSVSVSFSDPEVRAFAETQTAEILKNLKEQYSQDVNFSFAQQGENPFGSLTSHRSRAALSKPTTKPDDVQHAQSTMPDMYARDQNVWIG